MSLNEHYSEALYAIVSVGISAAVYIAFAALYFIGEKQHKSVTVKFHGFVSETAHRLADIASRK